MDMRKVIIGIGLFLALNHITNAQSVDIYHDNLPEFLEKRNVNGLIRLVKDSIILQDDITIGKYRKVVQNKNDKEQLSYVFFQKNGKPIGDVLIKDKAKGKVVAYTNKDGVEAKFTYSTSIDEYEMIVFFLKFYIKNKYL
jgi:hypothetical protein